VSPSEETHFRLSSDTYISKDAVITAYGRKLSKQEVLDLFSAHTDDFLRAFRALSKEDQVAIRLRYGNNTLKWYEENRCTKRS